MKQYLSVHDNIFTPALPWRRRRQGKQNPTDHDNHQVKKSYYQENVNSVQIKWAHRPIRE